MLHRYTERIIAIATDIQKKTISPEDVNPNERNTVQEYLMLLWIQKKFNYKSLPTWITEERVWK